VDDDLAVAIRAALRIERADAAALGALFSWERATDQFLAALTAALEGDRGLLSAA